MVEKVPPLVNGDVIESASGDGVKSAAVESGIGKITNLLRNYHHFLSIYPSVSEILIKIVRKNKHQSESQKNVSSKTHKQYIFNYKGKVNSALNVSQSICESYNNNIILNYLICLYNKI